MLSLAIIAKNEKEKLLNIINKYSEFFDEIVIGSDSDELLELQSDKVKVFKYERSEQENKLGYIFFDRKRNWLRTLISGDYYVRLDADDEIYNVRAIKDIYEKAKRQNVDIVYTWYDYSRDQYGNTTAGHNRETLIKNTDKIYWNKRIHENIIPVPGYNQKTVIEKSFHVVHNIDDLHVEKSFNRNIKYLLDEYNEDPKNCDPRTLAYLGRSLLGAGNYDEAQKFLERHIKSSGWDEDRYMSWLLLSDICIHNNKYDEAIGCCNEALSERPDYPDAYLKLQEIYYNIKDFGKSIHWGKIGLGMKAPETFMLLDPSLYTWQPLIRMAHSLLLTNHAEEALLFLSKAKKYVPELEWITENESSFVEAVNSKKFIEGLMLVLGYIAQKGLVDFKPFFESLPNSIKNNELVWAIYKQYCYPKKWEDNSVVFYCPETAFDWSPIDTISGIGGSEEAVIYLTKELVKLGKNVTVYNNCGEKAGNYSGVIYKNLAEFDIRDDFNVIVSWRHNIFHGGNLHAKKKIVWLHDVIDGEMAKQFFSSDADFDKVIVLSQFHKDIIKKHVDESKIFVSSNGINLKDFSIEVERNPYRMIYTSSYDRGLEHLLDIWKDVKAAVPEAELKIFYGWDTYDKFVQLGTRPLEYKLIMQKLMQQDGIEECGRVGHRRLAVELKKSKFWVYPSHFEEISCISAMKAQAAGCVPVCTEYAALKETVKDGVIVPGKCGSKEINNLYKEALIKALKEQPTINVDKEQFSWEKVAQQWVKDLL